MLTGCSNFPKSYRLLNPFEYRQVFNTGKKLHGKYFILFISESDQIHSRIGLIISKKVSKHAVQRNRIKRQIRESYRMHKHHLPAIDIVVMAKKSAVNQDNSFIQKILLQHWNNISV